MTMPIARWLHGLNTNPVAHLELHHQWNVIEKSRSGRIWIALALVMLLPALLASLIFFAAALLGRPLASPLTGADASDIGSTALSLGQLSLLTMNVAQYMVVMLVAYGLSSNSIAREKRGRTWENLLLTDISARTIVIGKCWASLRALYGDHIVVGVLRIGLLAYLLTALGPFALATANGGLGLVALETIPFSAGQLLMLAALVLAFTLIDTVMNTAMGLMVALLDVPGAVGISLFAVLRALATAFGLWWIVTTVNLMWFSSPGMYAVFGTGLLVVYAGLTWGMLRLAQMAAVVGSNASPAPRPVTKGSRS
jgi:ABC-type transport system involved in multi-copper enzyme maturation permease subunit